MLCKEELCYVCMQVWSSTAFSYQKKEPACSQCCYSESKKQCRETRGHCCLEMTKQHRKRVLRDDDRGRSGRNVEGCGDGKCHERTRRENEWLGRVQNCFW